MSSSTFAQVDTTKVSFIAYWSVGDVYKYEVSKYKKQWRGEDLIKNDYSKYLANMIFSAFPWGIFRKF